MEMQWLFDVFHLRAPPWHKRKNVFPKTGSKNKEIHNQSAISKNYPTFPLSYSPKGRRHLLIKEKPPKSGRKTAAFVTGGTRGWDMLKHSPQPPPPLF